MRKLFVPFLFFFMLTISAQSSIDRNQGQWYSGTQMELFIPDVFQYKTYELVFISSGGRLEMSTGLLQSRTNILYASDYRYKKIKSALDLSLTNKHNPKLERNLKTSVTTFNPLKYDLPMFPKDKTLFWLRITDCDLMISPITNLKLIAYEKYSDFLIMSSICSLKVVTCMG